MMVSIENVFSYPSDYYNMEKVPTSASYRPYVDASTKRSAVQCWVYKGPGESMAPMVDKY